MKNFLREILYLKVTKKLFCRNGLKEKVLLCVFRQPTVYHVYRIDP